MFSQISKRRPYIILILFMLLLFHGLNNYIVLTKSRYYLGPDSGNYFIRANRTLQTLTKVKLNLKSIYETYDQVFERQRSNKPPLFFITSSPFFLFFSNKNIIIVMSNLIYFAILLFATYGIGEKLYNFEVGILSAFLVSMFPTVFALSRVFMTDFALMAIVSLTFYLFTLNRFTSIKFSLLTGIIIGLGSLVRQSYFIFLLPILFYFLLQKDNLKSKEIMRNFIFSITVGLFISAFFYIWYSYPYYYIIFKYKNNVEPFFYLQSLLNRQLLIPFFLLFLLSLVFSFRKQNFFLPTMIIVLLAIFSIPPNKTDRFILPIFPYIAVVISEFIWSLVKTKRLLIRGLLIGSLILFSFLQYFKICFTQTLYRKFPIDDFGLFSIINQGDWQSPIEEIIQIVSNDIGKIKTNRRIMVLIISQNFLFVTNMEWLLINRKLSVELRRILDDSKFLSGRWSKKIEFDFDNQITQSDFLIIEEMTYEKYFHTRCLLEAFERNFNKFKPIKTIQFPDKSLYYIYRNKETR